MMMLISTLLADVVIIFKNRLCIRVAPKIWQVFVRLITSSNIDQYVNFFTVKSGENL